MSRIGQATNIPTTLPPSGSAAGDLSGTYPSPSVVDDSHNHSLSTISDFSTHTGDASAHHSPVTIGTNTANALSLSGQQLSLGDVFVQLAGGTMTGDLVLYNNILHTLNYSLTVPATGTAALLATANVFTANQTIDGTTDAVQLMLEANGTQTNKVLAIRKSGASTPRFSVDENGKILCYLYPETGSSVVYGMEINAPPNSSALDKNKSEYYYDNSGTSIAYNKHTFPTTSGVFRLQLFSAAGAGTARTYDFGFSNLVWGIASINLTGIASGTAREFISSINSSVQIVSFGGNNNPSVGFINLASGTSVFEFQVAGTAVGSYTNTGIWSIKPSTTVTNAPLTVLGLRASVSTASTGFANGGGVGMTFTAETATNDTFQLQGDISTSWIDATNATRKAKLSLSAYDTAQRIGMEIEADGSVAKLGFYGANPVVKPTALTTADASAINTGDATTDMVIANMRTRIGELETKLQGLGLLT